MMHNIRKRVGCYLMLLALVYTFTSISEVNAKQKTTGNNELSNNACQDALFDGSMLTSNNSNKSIKIYAKEGKWKIKYVIDIDSTSADYSLVLGNKAKPTVLDYIGGSPLEIPVGGGNAIFLIAEPVSKNGNIVKSNGELLKVEYTNKDGSKDTTTCKAGKVFINNSKKVDIKNTAAYISKTFKGNSIANISINQTDNPDEYNECLAMQLGKLDVNDTEPYLSNQTDLDKYNDQMKKSFPYCYGPYNSSFELTANTIKNIRKKSLKAYKQYIEFVAAKKDNSEYTASEEEIKNDGYKLLKYSSKGMNVEKLSCTKEQLTDKTVKYYTRKEEANNNLCSVICQEQIQITYAPPVATKAGMCFQYKVTVRSKVTCKTELTGQIEWPTPPNVCDFSPICEGNEQETQAGPTEEFDACINNCDGGKYSQSCINSCYNKVYSNKEENDNSTRKTSTTSSKINAENVLKLANKSSDPYYEIEGCKNNAQIKAETLANPGNSKCAKAFYKLKQKEPMGKYVKSNKFSWYNYIWKPDDNVAKTKWSPLEDNWIESIKRSSPYYFRNYDVALRTIQSFYGVNNGYNGYGEARSYIIDDGGIKRQRTKTYNCSETCGFISENDNDCISSNGSLKEYYYKKFDDIEAKLSQCTTAATCKEDTATFDMSVDNSVMKDKSTKDKSKWNATNKTNNDSKTCYSPSGNIKMFIPILPSTDEKKELLPPDLEKGDANSECSINPNGINGKCYGKDNSNYWQHYKTTITFPGTWIDLKTGKRVYQKDDYNKDTMREKPNYYCVGYDYDPVNEQWWDWKINGIGKIDNIKIEKDDNITASIANFGKYSWNVKLNCFYALSNKVTTCVGKNCNPSCIGTECYTTIQNIKLRPVDQVDLFAGRTGNMIGFNWTSAAQDKVAGDKSGYNIDPGKYAEKLQKEAKANPNIVYSGATDYSLHLTKGNINELRKYVKENKGYNKYNGENKNEVEDTPGLYYYKSNILEDNKYTTNFSRDSSILGKNNN